jgi:hypothetical protein
MAGWLESAGTFQFTEAPSAAQSAVALEIGSRLRGGGIRSIGLARETRSLGTDRQRLPEIGSLTFAVWMSCPSVP